MPYPTILASIESFEPRRLLAAGDLDPSFGDGGLVFDPPSVGPDDLAFIADVEALPGDKILVAGSVGDREVDANDYLLRRYNADGSLDTAFGTNGSSTGRFNGLATFFQNVAPLPNGKIMVHGHQFVATGSQAMIARFNADGSLDTAYAGGAGFFTIEDRAAMGVAPDGSVVLDTDSFGVQRYTADGTLDAMFGGGDGSAESLLDGLAHVVLLQPDGKILLGGALDDEAVRFAVVRLNADGSPDASFGDGGKVVANVTGLPFSVGTQSVRDLHVLPDGRILAMGIARLIDTGVSGAVVQLGVARFLSDGTVDPTFGNNGGTTVELDAFPGRMRVDGDGRIYLCAGGAARLTPDGQLDPSFGVVTASAGVGAALLSDGTLVLSGRTRKYHDFDRLVLVGLLTEDNGVPSPITFGNGTASLVGTAGDDLITVTDKRAVDVRLNGFGRAFLQEDVDLVHILAGEGADVVRLAETRFTNFFVEGGDGSDRIAGGRLADTLVGGAQRDFIDGGAGNDKINGNGGNDQLGGQSGNDRIYGGPGNDRMFGGSGNDRLRGDAGSDTMTGNAGDDMFLAADGVVDQLFGEGGRDVAESDDDDVLTSVEVRV